jgi:uncharacterized protein YoxC
MSFEQIFYVSQSLAAVAVIASLLYLAQQVRQAERVLQHEAGMLSDAAFDSYVAGV